MNAPKHFEFREGHAYFRPAGPFTVAGAIKVGSEAIRHAVEQEADRLLLVASDMTGLPVPTTWERFALAEEWSRVAGRIKVALVCPERLLDPARFGVTVARNRGMNLSVFTGESEALAWLLESP